MLWPPTAIRRQQRLDFLRTRHVGVRAREVRPHNSSKARQGSTGARYELGLGAPAGLQTASRIAPYFLIRSSEVTVGSEQPHFPVELRRLQHSEE